MAEHYRGRGFEVSLTQGAAWVRLWWSVDDDRPHFARRLLNYLGKRVLRVEVPRPQLVLDLREAPPMANFPMRLAIGALLGAAERHAVPTTLLVGPTSLQMRDMTELVRRCAPGVGGVRTVARVRRRRTA